MEVVTTVTNALIVGAVGLLLAAMTRGLRGDLLRFKADIEQRFAEVGKEIAEVRADLRTEIAEARSDARLEFTEVRREIAEVRTEVRELRSDLTQVALAVGARPRADSGS